jgi:hypothetical protein
MRTTRAVARFGERPFDDARPRDQPGGAVFEVPVEVVADALRRQLSHHRAEDQQDREGQRSGDGSEPPPDW